MSTDGPRRRRRGRSGASGLALVAGLFIGIGIGMLVDEVAAGLMLGLGVGFLAMGILRAILGEW
ncbi:MAG: hypothetical protein R3C39_02470 [Dehalococcoidia bacterium]